MNEAKSEEIKLVFRLADFEGPNDESDAADDEDDPCTSPVIVVRIEDDLFQVDEPTSLTPFGPLGPFLGLGTKIRVKKMKGGGYRLAGIQEGPGVWTWRFHARQESLREDDVTATLDTLSERGCRWEFCSGNFTIQRFRGPNETFPDDSLVEKIKLLRDRTEFSPTDDRRPPTDQGTQV